MTARSSFARYAREKQAVAEALRAVQAYFESQSREIAGETLRSLLSRLAEDRFNLVVVGQFKRGKSSLINALVGRDILPTAIVPLTSIVTSIRYGPTERALVHREDGGPAFTVALSELADYVTERGNPNNEKKILSVEVEVPSAFLRRGFYLVDTPGIGSVYQANTATTYAFLPQADAVIFVTSIESPLTDNELSFVDTIRQSVERVFFVLNKIDQASPADQRDAITFVERLLRERLGTPALRLFALSARQALEGKISGEHRQVEQSGLPAFEEALATFLGTEREATFLRATLDRAHRLLVEEKQLLGLLHDRSDANGNEPRKESLARYLDELAGQRDAVLQELDTRRRAFLDEFLAPAAAAFADAERVTLLKELESRASESWEADADAAYQRARGWLHETLDARRRAWLTEHSGAWEEAARDLLRIARQAVDGAGATRASPAHPSLTWSWGISEHPPAFEVDGARSILPSHDLGEASPLFSFPRLIAMRALRRRLRADLDREIVQTAQAMQAAVERYLSAVIDQIRREMDRALVDLRKAIESPAPEAARQAEPAGGVSGPDAQARQVEALIARVAKLRAAVEGPAEIEPSTVDDSHLARPREPIEAPTGGGVSRATLENALRRGECPVCSIVRDAVWELLCHWQYALATDDAARQVFRADGGFCNEHTWALEAVASPRGLCAGYLPLLDHLVQEIGALPGLPRSTIRDRLATILPDAGRCRLCTFKRQREQAALRDLATLLATAEGRADYLRSAGLCLPHTHALLDRRLNEETVRFLIEETARHLSTAADDTRGYVLKVDARRRDLITPPEERSYVRVPTLLAGGNQSFRSPG